jgi:hypothetical protein
LAASVWASDGATIPASGEEVLVVPAVPLPPVLVAPAEPPVAEVLPLRLVPPVPVVPPVFELPPVSADVALEPPELSEPPEGVLPPEAEVTAAAVLPPEALLLTVDCRPAPDEPPAAVCPPALPPEPPPQAHRKDIDNSGANKRHEEERTILGVMDAA